MDKEETYIGDGVYASCDGYQVWIRAERDGCQNTVALEPEVMRGLIRYATNLHPNWAKFIRESVVSS